MDIEYEAIFGYSLPIFLFADRIKDGDENLNILNSKKWWQIILTTRHILAHFPLYYDEEEAIDILCANMRNLYRLFGTDLSSKRSLGYYSNHDDSYLSLNDITKRNEPENIKKLKLWVPKVVTKNHDLISKITFKELEEDFKSNETELLSFKKQFGKLVYEYVSSKDTNRWAVVFPKKYRE